MDKGKWIAPYLKQYQGLLVLAILLGVLTILFGSGLMFTSGYLISKAATRPESILMVYVPIVGVRAFGIGRAVLSYIDKLTGHQFILKILSDMRARLYKVVEPQAHFLKSRFLTGDLLAVLADDIEHLQDFYLKTLLPSIVSLAIYIIAVICAGTFSIPFAILEAFFIGLLIFVGPILSYIYIKAKKEKIKQRRNHLYQQLTDAVFGISDWLFSGRHLDFIKRFENEHHELQIVETKIHKFVNFRAVFNQLLLGVIVILAVYWASSMSLKGKMPPTLIAALGLVTMSIIESFLPISTSISDISAYQDSIKRLNQLDADIRNDQNEIDFSMKSEIFIELNKVSFQYPSGPPLLEDFNLKVLQGEKIAILGPSGAGKSTLLQLIQGTIKPASGEILLNRYKAHEVTESIPKVVSVLNQKAYLFHTSVLNNIRLGNENATEDEVFKAAERVQLHEMVKGLPDGYSTNMQETGHRFSGGERQRIALARVLLQNTPVVILDEPTVGLDPITEKNLLATIFDALQGKTIIWVTHHLTGMQMMDQIIFMDQGKVTMSGSHRQLLEKEERYRCLYELDQPFSNFKNHGTH